jgi:hypothetical protein
MSFRQVTRIAVITAGFALATVPAFAWNNPPPSGGCSSNCGGNSVPEPSTLALLGIAIPGAAAWIKRKIG